MVRNSFGRDKKKLNIGDGDGDIMGYGYGDGVRWGNGGGDINGEGYGYGSKINNGFSGEDNGTVKYLNELIRQYRKMQIKNFFLNLNNSLKQVLFSFTKKLRDIKLF